MCIKVHMYMYVLCTYKWTTEKGGILSPYSDTLTGSQDIQAGSNDMYMIDSCKEFNLSYIVVSLIIL